MQFRTWLETNMQKRVQWDFAITLPALGIQGISSEPPLLNQGSHADIYANPVDPNTLIKITNDKADVRHTLAAQNLNSPNVVKCHRSTNSGVVGGTALLVDHVKGGRAPYSTPEFLGLMEGKRGTDPRSQSHQNIQQPDAFRSGILSRHNRLNQTELDKLSQLFQTIFLLESRLNIFLADLSENVIDAGSAYVIVDFGR